MSQSRLSTAVDDGLIDLPSGDIAVLRPAAGADLSALPQDRVLISHTFRPDHDHWQAAGYVVSRDAVPADLAIVTVPRSKALARALVSQAASLAPVVVVDGQRTDGVDSLWTDLRRRAGDLPSVTKAHGRLFVLRSAELDLSDWAAPPPAAGPEGFVTQAGVFSEDRVDAGSAALATALPGKMGPRVADMGAGWGYLSAAILSRDGVRTLDVIEAEALALDCARLNVTDPRAAFHWADATRFVPAASYDIIVTNPPFHVGRAGDPALGRAFIAAAAGMLMPHGALWLVANRHLPYEQALRDRFARVDEAAGTGAFKVFHAQRPVTRRSR